MLQLGHVPLAIISTRFPSNSDAMYNQPYSSLRPPPSPESRIGKFLAKSIQLKNILGTGAYGVVYAAVDVETQQWYAVKALNKVTSTGHALDERQRGFQIREIKLHYEASAHPNIASIHRIVDLPDCTYVILEYCEDGDLFTNITEYGRFIGDEPRIKNAFLQILDAVDHCHRLRIYHRDIKPENILVSHNGQRILLADFGLATRDPISQDHGCGSTFYMSPECLDQSKNLNYLCAPNDVWSLGVVLLNLTCGRNPWKQASLQDPTFRAFTKSPNFLQTILPISDELNMILLRIFDLNPKTRLDLSSLRCIIQCCSKFTGPIKC